ncbi:MAG: rhodanese-like domain-containing protein [Actinomycetota bacterium]
MKLQRFALGTAAWLALSFGAAAGVHQTAWAEPPASLRADGKALYQSACARCHGADGSDTTSYPNVKSLVDVTQRMSAVDVIEKSKGFATVQLQGQEGVALVAYLQTFRAGQWAAPELLVETEWMSQHLKAPKTRIVDMRSEAAYAAGHIPGAVRVSSGPLRDPKDQLDYLPRPETFAELMGKAGIDNDTHVVIYDDRGGSNATRLWFVLNAYGHERMSLVNGGWLKWAAEKRPITTEAVQLPAATFTPKKVPNAVCAAPELLARKPGVVVLDTRSEAEFNAGRIPNAVRVEWKENVTGPYQVFKSGPELKKLYESKGVTPDKEVVTY